MPSRRTLNKATALPVNDRSIASVLDNLSSDELSRLASDVVAENRRRLDYAQSLFESLDSNETAAEAVGNQELYHKYNLALLELKIHHELVRIILDELGYVPEVTSSRKRAN